MTQESDRDWREWAYVNKENWPECIPWMRPKREYGPYPWGEKAHYDPHDLDDYPHSHPDAASVGHSYMGDVCPSCGVPLDWTGTVVLITGEKGVFAEIDEVDDPTPAYHVGCWEEREAEIHKRENTSLEQFA